MPEYSKKVTETYWDMMGMTEWEHDDVQLKIVTSGDFVFEVCECSKCKLSWAWDTKNGYCDYPDKKCTIPDPISLSSWELAGFMRGKCQKQEIAGSKGDWGEELMKITSNGDIYNLLLSDPDQWIEAACKAWKIK